MIVDGTRVADAEWLIKDGGSGAASVMIANATTGETALWANALVPGAWLRLKSDGHVAEVSTDDGDTWVPRPENLTGLVPRVQGGVDNSVTVTGVDGTVKWHYFAVEAAANSEE